MVETSLGGANVRFQPTLWTTVLRARDAGGEEARAAVGRLVERYWKPLYFFARRRGLDIEAAKDATQGFFLRAVEADFLRDVAPEKGRFRNWLLAAMSHFLSDQREREAARKRGAARTIPLDVEGVERQVAASADPPDLAFRRIWAVDLLDGAMVRLRKEWAERDRATEFTVLSQHLGGPAGSIAETAGRLKVAEHDVKNLLHRMRGRLREILREEVASSVEDPALVDEELAELFAALSR